MKTLFVVGGLPFGGIESLLFDISQELLRRSYPFKIVNLSGTGQRTQDFEEAGIPLIKVGNSLKEIKTYKLKTAQKLKEIIEREKAQIIHSVQFSGDYFSRLALIFDRRRKVITNIQTIRIEKRFERRVLNRILSFRTDAYISASKEIFKMVEKEHNLFNKPHYILYNGVDFKKFNSQLGKINLTKFKDKKVFLFIGRLVKLKRVDLIIKAISIITRKNKKVALAIVGDGKERVKLEELTKKLNAESFVHFFGYQKEVAPFLSNAFALVMPSEHEGLPITHIEAAYFGLPAIISPFVPSREIFPDSSLVSPLSAEEIAKRMEILLENEELYRRMSQKAKETAKNYSIERYTDTLIDFYERLIEGKLPEERVLF